MVKEIVLASASKRRSQILKSCGIKHKVIISRTEELLNQDMPISKIVRINAEAKAKAVMPKCRKNAIIVSADTLVAHGREIVGKPANENSAREMLERFSGNYIEVYTGLCVLDNTTAQIVSDVDVSDISVARISKADIEKCFHMLGPYDKAGGFSIEGVGSIIFDDIKGSYFNILGMSMMKLKELFSKLDFDIFDFVTL
jgi:septum formation protein